MKKIMMMVIAAMIATAISASAQSVYSSSGGYRGKVESNGRVYDQTGSYQGKIDSNGSVYDRTGSYQGKIESNGRVYNRSGSYMGQAQGITTQKAACLFFFGFFKVLP